MNSIIRLKYIEAWLQSLREEHHTEIEKVAISLQYQISRPPLPLIERTVPSIYGHEESSNREILTDEILKHYGNYEVKNFQVKETNRGTLKVIILIKRAV